MTDQFDPDALRKEFADYCDDVAPGIKAKAPRLNQMETLALIGMTLFQACKDLKAERNQLVDEISGLRSARTAYASEFPLNADGEPDVGNVHANIRAMKKDAERYRWLNERYIGFDFGWSADENGDNGKQVLCFEMDNGMRISADIDASIDAQIAASEPKNTGN